MLKIKEEREVVLGNGNQKNNEKDEKRNKILKYRPSLKDTMEEPEKSLLPVLRRNKIFTIASEPCGK